MSYTLACGANQTDVVTRCTILLLTVFSFLSLAVAAQVGVDYDLQNQKPARFENRTLASEKSNDGKKFKKPRHFIQNTVTHYNFFFNANNKLNEVIARAKEQNKDDYTQLLSFYNYTLEATLAQKKELDSVIYKCTAGILIHDTRNDWIDNLYLLIGKSFFFRKTFDSAYITFQFLNFAFAPKESDGYDKPIGSNANVDEGGNNNIVSTVEKRNIAQKIFSPPPSRNDALVWQIRTYIARDQYAEAAALIAVLKKDPQFPPRLAADLEEMQALWFYRRSIYDSAAAHLFKALPIAADNEERARWEYLIAQLHERSGDHYEAKLFYERAVHDTYNPVLDVYARLNAIRQNKDSASDYIQKNIEALEKLARKDRYESYRDIIYYTAAQIELERNNRAGAQAFLLKCIRSSSGSLSGQRNKAFLQLANMSFEEKNYRAAKSYYDSLNLAALFPEEQTGIPDRKKALAGIVAQLQVIDRQDSLQRIAMMAPNERDIYIKKLVRGLRKQQGLRDEDLADGSGGPLPINNNAPTAPDLFSSGAAGTDWYFYNASLKAKGYSDFKAKWGNRPNVDNWQMASLVTQARTAKDVEHQGAVFTETGAKDGAGPPAIDFKTLLAGLPLTPEKLQLSQDTIARALFVLGKICQEGLPDYGSAINAYDSVLQRTKDKTLREESLLGLYYCYKKTGDEVNANKVLEALKRDFPGSKSTAMAVNPDSVARAADETKARITREYDKIYNSFIEGRFDEALAEKKEADSLYGSTYWTPQLLYIESVFFIRTRQDARAGMILNSIKTKFPNTPMAEKAARLLDVLGRRKQIETYLTNLKVTRASDSMDLAAGQPGQAAQRPQPGNRNVVAPDRIIYSRDSTKKRPDTIQASVLRAQADSLRSLGRRGKADSAKGGGKPQNAASLFAMDADKPQSVMILMDKVDPVYVTETKNAFDRYDQENYYSQALTIDKIPLNDSLKMVVIGSFSNAAEALDYLGKARALAPRNIVPWLPAGKYSFLIISPPNLAVLLTNKDMPAYRRFLATAFPGKF